MAPQRTIQRVLQILRAPLSDLDEFGYKNEDTSCGATSTNRKGGHVVERLQEDSTTLADSEGATFGLGRARL